MPMDREEVPRVSTIPSAAPTLTAQDTARVVLRRPTHAQGRALEILGHAIEYLVDSRLYSASPASSRNEAGAAQLLMRLSRAVFADCPERVPLHRRLRAWLLHRP
jgi:hypothetical protein